MRAIVVALLLVSAVAAARPARPNTTIEDVRSIILGMAEAGEKSIKLKPAKGDNMNTIIRVADADFAGGSYPIVSISNHERTDYARLCPGDGITCSGGCIEPGETVIDVEDFTSTMVIEHVGALFHRNPLCIDSITFELGSELFFSVMIPFTAELLYHCGVDTKIYGDNKRCALLGYEDDILYNSISIDVNQSWYWFSWIQQNATREAETTTIEDIRGMSFVCLISVATVDDVEIPINFKFFEQDIAINGRLIRSY
ncbi:hypothetical protein MVEG_11001 [Podila verticillata NRRL 6337]|uniref:Ubiquitin 3 binding protein But2 C-terminal domain-containing protein n=1 Tax=Podila verticillata NRRL 6337 TaxID=1069443 RepID=A0A086TLY6_9FUNG|nr:hypothetical protein MVEG_11001 [Podila verticillata NRRL 6337]